MEHISESSALLEHTAGYDADPGAWWSKYGEHLLVPLPAIRPPRTRSVDERGNVAETANLYSLFRSAQRSAREAGWDGRPDGWSDAEVHRAIAIEKRAWDMWWNPIYDRLRELATTTKHIEKTRPPHWEAMAQDLVSQGDRMVRKISGWKIDGAVAWIPPRRGCEDGSATVLDAWREASESWHTFLAAEDGSGGAFDV